MLTLAQTLLDLQQGYGKLHGDVKPNNVMVPDDQHTVLLDFGLARAKAHIGRDSQEVPVGGGPPYTAPEVFELGAYGPAADWYGFGATLYEVVVGEVPYYHRPEIFRLQHKMMGDPLEFPDHLPDGMVELITDLMRPMPAERPSGEQVVQRLSALIGREATPPDPTLQTRDFIGRAAEFRTLNDAFDEAASRLVVVSVEGPSGVGKTALIDAWLQRLPEPTGILTSRCALTEHLPYRTLDGTIDEISRLLMFERNGGRTPTRPTGARALQHLFPVLLRVPDFSLPNETAPNDPLEKQRKAFRGLLDTLRSLASQRRLVMWIDDAQWGDSDSMGFFRLLFGAGSRCPILLILTHRDHEAQTPSVTTSKPC